MIVGRGSETFDAVKGKAKNRTAINAGERRGRGILHALRGGGGDRVGAVLREIRVDGRDGGEGERWCVSGLVIIYDQSDSRRNVWATKSATLILRKIGGNRNRKDGAECSLNLRSRRIVFEIVRKTQSYRLPNPNFPPISLYSIRLERRKKKRNRKKEERRKKEKRGTVPTYKFHAS